MRVIGNLKRNHLGWPISIGLVCISINIIQQINGWHWAGDRNTSEVLKMTMLVLLNWGGFSAAIAATLLVIAGTKAVKLIGVLSGLACFHGIAIGLLLPLSVKSLAEGVLLYMSVYGVLAAIVVPLVAMVMSFKVRNSER